MHRKKLIRAVSLAAVGLLLSNASAGDGRKIKVDLTGFEEVPVVITTGNGGLKLTINDSATAIDYVLDFADLQADITQAHVHVAQEGVNGAIVLWLCQTTGTPAPPAIAAITPFCDSTAGNTPRRGTVTGTWTSANVLAIASQQVAAGNLEDALIAITSGKAYGNVHTTVSLGGEIRGQLKHDRGRKQHH